MGNISITHQKTGVDYVGGPATNSQTLFAGDWNAVHFILSAGSGISIVSDGATPPIITFTLGGAGNLTIGGSVSAGTGFQTNSTAIATSLLLSNGVGFGIPAAPYEGQLGLVGCPDIVPSGDMCAEIGKDDKRILIFNGPTWRNTGTAFPKGLTMQVGDFSLQVETDTSSSAWSFRPDTGHDALVNLGSVGARWNNAYFAGTVSVGTLQYTTLSPAVAGGSIGPGTVNSLPRFATSTTIASSIIAQQNATQVSVGGNIIPSDFQANVATLGSLGSGFQKLYLANDNTGQIITQGGTIKTDALFLPTIDQGSILGSDSFRAGTIKTIGLSNSSGPLSLAGNGNTETIDTKLDPITGLNIGTLFPSSDENLNLGTPSQRVAVMVFSRTISFGGAGQGTIGSLGYSSNTSVAMAFGGSAVGRSIPDITTLVDKIPVRINGVTRYIPLYAN